MKNQIKELGEKELAKIQRKQIRDDKFTAVAEEFVKEFQKAYDKGDECSIAAWDYKNPHSEIFPTTKYQPSAHDLIKKRTGEEMLTSDNKSNPDYPKNTFAASFKKTKSGYALWPFVSTWKAKIINKILRVNFQVGKHDIAVLYMDCRGVGDFKRKGKK